MKLNLHQIFQDHKVTPRGIIYVGAGEGRSLKRFAKFTNAQILLIEANPVTCERLKMAVGDRPNIQTVHVAIADQNSTATLHVTNIESNSSILSLTEYKKLYPNLTETQQIPVETRTIDSILTELNLLPEDYNILCLDIQGAELLALTGASEILQHLDAIYSTTSQNKLFEGGATFEQLNAFLNGHYFTPVAQATPYHPSRYEVVYIHNNLINTSVIPSEIAQNLRLQPPTVPKPTELKITQSRLQELESEQELLKYQLQQTRKDLEKSQSDFQQKQKELENSQSQLQQTQKDLEKSQSDFQEKQKELENSQSQLQQTQLELKNLHSQLEQSQEELEESKGIRDQILADLEKSSSQLKQTQTELQQSQYQRDQILSELEQYHTRLQQTQKDLEKSQSDFQQKQKELENSQSQLQQTQKDLEKSQSDFQQKQKELENSQSQLQQTQKDLEKSQSDFQQKQKELENSQ
ncbi:FkbM family methyltransferase, partial [Limnospira fusiformis]|uniref:FkbM family methyltransferase n=1 Tax=Limnospira fusiformis TaxID=54297 RepID=UPI002AA28FEB|nr:FkbM family methyltransferase [Limnospira fusiformis LS22]